MPSDSSMGSRRGHLQRSRVLPRSVSISFGQYPDGHLLGTMQSDQHASERIHDVQVMQNSGDPDMGLRPQHQPPVDSRLHAGADRDQREQSSGMWPMPFAKIFLLYLFRALSNCFLSARVRSRMYYAIFITFSKSECGVSRPAVFRFYFLREN